MVAMINNVLLRGIAAVSELKVRLTEERGQDVLEYALIGGLMAAALVLIATVFNGAVASMAGEIRDCIDFHASTACTPGP